MTRGIRGSVLALLTATLAAGAILATMAASAGAATTIYNNIASPIPGNVVSEGFECCSAREFGGQVTLAPGKWKNPKVTVLMSSWACQEGSWTGQDCKSGKSAKFEWPITVSVYEVGPENAPGAKIGAASKVVKIRYRPSASAICKSIPEHEGGWYDKSEEHCYNGIASKVSMPLKIAKLPQKVIISVAYNTSDYGLEPQRPKPCNSTTAGCPYDSLNVGAEDALPESSYPLPSYAYIDSTYSNEYCGSATPLGTFGISGSEGNPCWTGYQPSFSVAATPG